MSNWKQKQSIDNYDLDSLIPFDSFSDGEVYEEKKNPKNLKRFYWHKEPTSFTSFDVENESLAHMNTIYDDIFRDNGLVESHQCKRKPSSKNKSKKSRRLSTISEPSSCISAKDSKKRQKWSKKDDVELINAVNKFQGKNWKLISDEVGTNKTHIQCLQRWKQVLQPGLKKGNWNREEDICLLRLMNSLGAVSENPTVRNSNFTDWKTVEKCMDGRTAKQCRERWLLNIDPSINKTVWKRSEDEQLLKLQIELGNKWSTIKDILQTNRTENAVKLRFNFIKRQAKKNIGTQYVLDTLNYNDVALLINEWTIDQDRTLILFKTLLKRTFVDVLCEDLFQNEKTTKTLRQIISRWEYLCSLDSKLKEVVKYNVPRTEIVEKEVIGVINHVIELARIKTPGVGENGVKVECNTLGELPSIKSSNLKKEERSTKPRINDLKNYMSSSDSDYKEMLQLFK